MSTLEERKQVGPMRLDDLVALVAAVAARPAKEAELVEEARARLKEEQEEARRRAIKAVFGDLGGKGPLSWNENALLSPPAEDVRFALGPEGSPDFLARYLPWQGRDPRSGVYFARKNILAALRRNPGVDARAFLGAIAVHELFHCLVERLVGDAAAYAGHACSPWCGLEEAGANFVARRYAEADPESLATFEELLFRRREAGGLPGYGEYHLLDERIVPAIGYLKSRAAGACVAPADYQKAMAALALAPAALDSHAQAFWAATMTAANSGGVAFYYDMLN